MLNNLKIGHKMLLFSGTFLTLLFIVLAGGMYGMSTSVQSSQTVSDIMQLDSRLTQLEVDHLIWAGQVSDFVYNDAIDELNAQTDHTKCGFGKWYYGDARKHAEQSIPGISGNLKDLEEPHRLLHASAAKISADYRSADPDLPRFLIEKELEHMRWANILQQAILGKANSAKVNFDHTQCAFGRFLYGNARQKLETADPELARIFNAIEKPHEQLHLYGKDVNVFLGEAAYVHAGRYFAEQALPQLTVVSNLLSQAVQAANEAIQGKQLAQQIYASETSNFLGEVQRLLTTARDNAKDYKVLVAGANIATVKKSNATNLGIGVFALVLGTVIAVFLSRSLTNPMRQAVSMLMELENGHLDSRLKLKRKDEIGLMADSMDRFADSLQVEVVDNLQKLAEGNLDFNVTPRDEQDKLRSALQKLNRDLHEMIGEIRTSGEQIASGSGQVADASQSLSQGATEQASSLEEISASLNEMSSQTTLNAGNANQANALSSEAQLAAEKGSNQMQSMVGAMTEINEAGQNISKIIKTIDEIAFQTNLLALNAAVEAARAGQHGKGFAVVAEEVRNLAARSAKAAEETAVLIQGSVEKTKNGSVIANQTADSLQEIVGGIGKVTDLVAEIAAASNEQAQGVSQINEGVNQIDQVTQQNTASSEECAASSEELSSQAEQLRQMLQRFTLKQEHQGQQLSSPVSASAPARGLSNLGWTQMAQEQRNVPSQIALDDSEFGKY